MALKVRTQIGVGEYTVPFGPSDPKREELVQAIIAQRNRVDHAQYEADCARDELRSAEKALDESLKQLTKGVKRSMDIETQIDHANERLRVVRIDTGEVVEERRPSSSEMQNGDLFQQEREVEWPIPASEPQ